MKLLLYRERGQNRQLEPVMENGAPVVITVADSTNAAFDYETAAWTTWSRGKAVDRGDYVVARVGKRYAVTVQPQTLTKALGPQVV